MAILDSMKLGLIVMVAVLAFPSLAKADYFVWQDPGSGLTLTFPDRWKEQTNNNVDTILTVMGPSDDAQPMCRVDVRDDKRFTIYPAKYGDAVQMKAVSYPFWQSFLAQYDDYSIGKVQDGASLGRWFASFATASYEKRFGTVMQARRAIMFASLYRDKLYVVECSALAHAYEQWELDFRGIIKSVDFKKAFHELPTGEYANFLKETELYFWAQSGPDGTTAY